MLARGAESPLAHREDDNVQDSLTIETGQNEACDTLSLRPHLHPSHAHVSSMPASVLSRFSSRSTNPRPRGRRSRSSASQAPTTPASYATTLPESCGTAPNTESSAPWHSAEHREGRRPKRARLRPGGGYLGTTKVVLITIGWVLITGMVLGASVPRPH